MINHPYSDLRDGDYVSYTIEGAALAGTPGRIVEILPTGNAIVRWNSGATSTSPLARLVRREPSLRERRDDPDYDDRGRPFGDVR
jgi:hypothetical protein